MYSSVTSRGGRALRTGALLSLMLGVVTAALAQPAESSRLRFEAATIKRAETSASPLPVAPSAPNRLRIPSQTLLQLIYTAYGNGGYNTAMPVTGGPDWINKTAFSVEGVAAEPSTPRQLRSMLQTLLEDRFALKISTETRSGEMLGLVLDRSDGTLGPKFRKWDGTCPAVMPALVFPAARRPLQKVGDTFIVPPESDADDPELSYCPTGYRLGGIRADGVTMATVASLLSLPPARALLGRVTVDQTGLRGRYTLDLDFVFPPPADAPSLSTAIKEQWGLRLVPSKGTFKAFHVESAQAPTTD
jgi:uncharacterized protein (TIGR03435 family)